jgi:trk system potassium uptake protein TrkH
MKLDVNLAPISYAVRPAVVAGYLGALCLLLALTALAPLLFALATKDWGHALRYGAVCLLLALFGFLLERLRTNEEVQRNEAYVVVVLIFIIASVVYALPMMHGGLPFMSALFESVSGITTTGLSTIGDVQALPRSVLFTAAWLQWIGGLGFLVLAFALLFGQGVNTKRLTGVLDERTGLLGGTRTYAAIVFRVYVALTVTGIVLLMLAGVDWFGALTLGLAAISTGGYSPYNASIADLDGAGRAVAMGTGVAGSLGMVLYYRLWRGEWRHMLNDREMHALWIFAGIGAAGITLDIWLSGRDELAGSLGAGVMSALSAQSTTGFSVLAIGLLPPFSKLLLIFAMLVGGSVGSTAGGIKLLRALIVVRLIQRLVLRTRILDHAVAPARFLGRSWPDDTLIGILLVVALYLVAIGLSWLAFLPYAYDPLDALFEVVSATGTVGLSTGITSSTLPVPLQAVLCADMLLGRLEILAVLVFLAPGTWIGRRRGSTLKEAGD